MNIFERITLKSKEKGLSIRKLEEESGLSNGTIKRWTTQEPGAMKLHNVANTLNVSIEWIITGKEAAELTPDENRLIECYRSSDPAGRDAIRGQAEYQASKALPEGVISFTAWKNRHR